MNTRISTTIAMALIVFVGICAGIVGILVWGHRDPGPFVSFLIGIIPLTIGVIWNTRQNDNIQKDVTQIQEQTNGHMAEQFKDLHARMDLAGIPPVPKKRKAKRNVERH